MRYFRRPINVLHYHSKSDLFFFFFFFFQSLLLSKQLIRDFFSDLLHGANEKEFTLLEERWLSEECMQAVMAFMQIKSKLQPSFHFLAGLKLELYRSQLPLSMLRIFFLTMLRIFLNSLFTNYSIVNRSIVINLILQVVCLVEKKELNASVETENRQRFSITYLLQAVYLYLFRHIKTARVCCRDSRHPGIKHEVD